MTELSKTSLEGTYLMDVKLIGTNVVVMNLRVSEIPGGVDVFIKAKLGVNKTPVLKVNVK
jgi:hypothetical protein